MSLYLKLFLFLLIVGWGLFEGVRNNPHK